MINICIKTELGDIVVEVYDEQAPRTAAHFMSYVDKCYYDGALFYRSLHSDSDAPYHQDYSEVKLNLIEGGWTDEYNDSILRGTLNEAFDESKGRIGTHGRIFLEPTNETGIRHVDGALSLGRTDPDKVDDNFTISIGANPELDAGGMRHPDGLGFPAFGKVIEGMDVVKKIHGLEFEGERINSGVEIISISRI